MTLPLLFGWATRERARVVLYRRAGDVLNVTFRIECSDFDRRVRTAGLWRERERSRARVGASDVGVAEALSRREKQSR